MAADDKKAEDTYDLLRLFGDVFERVRNEYVEEVTDEELIESAINGMLTSLDPHSSFMSSKNFKEMQVQTRGEFGGLGIQVTLDQGLIKVISPIDDTPAFRAGVEAGDIISHLDKEPVLGLTLSQAVDKMRGKVGSDIVLTVLRPEKEPFDITITRAVIKIQSVRSKAFGNVGYMRITQFNEQAKSGVKKAFEVFEKDIGKKMEGVILDLRNNPGGLLDQAISISDIFLEKGEIVSTRSRHAEETQRYNARVGDLAAGLPVVVLINGGSASASEIVAGALQDHERAIILGTKSFGKGSVQTIMPLQRKNAMRLTTSRYYTPSGKSIQAVGIDPDILVEPANVETLKSRTRQRESDLRGALDNTGENGTKEKAKEGKKEAKSEEEKQAELLKKDYQLARALDLIHGLAIFKKQSQK
ncbi:MAG: S41 family peptidase [Alphaproteobacteria bacterium]|nr:S41 family peptidase [Rhodospirillales bacterium]MCW9046110.1 S41 family peptidase [Alphaproteobacteria bacterium]